VEEDVYTCMPALQTDDGDGSIECMPSCLALLYDERMHPYKCIKKVHAVLACNVHVSSHQDTEAPDQVLVHKRHSTSDRPNKMYKRAQHNKKQQQSYTNFFLCMTCCP